MNFVDKLIKSWWIICSFVMFINGFGFLYLGFKRGNRNWVLEGILYETPWIMYILIYRISGPPVGIVTPAGVILLIAFILLLISIIRSIWVAVKLLEIYELEEDTTIAKSDRNENLGCCACVFLIFLVFAFIAIL